MSIPFGNDHSHSDEQSEHDAELLDGLRDGGWLDLQTFSPLQFAVPGLIPEGLTLFIGPPKVGKSWGLLDIGLAVAGSGPALGVIDVGPPRPVLMFALEDSDMRMQFRCRTLRPGQPIPPALQYKTRCSPAEVLPLLAAWLRRYGDQRPLVVIDTLGKVMPQALSGESSYQRDYRIGGHLKAAVDEHPGSSLVVLHHDRKADATDFVDAVSGTHGLAGSADTIIVLSRARGQSNGLLQVTGRDVTENEYAVELSGTAGWRLSGGGLDGSSSEATRRKVTTSLGDRSVDVFSEVQKYSEGVTPSVVAIETGLDKKHVQIYLARLAEQGRIVKLKRGTYAPAAAPSPPVGCVGGVGSDTNTLPLDSNTSNETNTPAEGEGNVIRTDRWMRGVPNLYDRDR